MVRHITTALTTLMLFGFVACAPKTAPLSDTGKVAAKKLYVVQLVNDASTAVIAANRAKQVDDAMTAKILTVNWQVLDVIEANPQSFAEKAMTIIRNARQGLPPELAAIVNSFLAKVINALEGR